MLIINLVKSKKQKTFSVNSISGSGLSEFDNNVVFINLSTLEDFFGYNSTDRNLEIYLINPQNIESQKNIVEEIFDQEFVEKKSAIHL